jgi:hypothetical protein
MVVRKLISLVFFITCWGNLAVGQAQSQPVADRPQVNLQQESGYIYIRAVGSTALTFIRVPTDAEIAEYRTRRAAAFNLLMERYRRDLANWERAGGDRSSNANRGSRSNIRQRPIEPSEATMEYAAIETQNTIVFGPNRRFSHDRDFTVYLQQVPSGTYIFYGPVFIDGGGPIAGTCYCMGTVAFDVRPGVITDLGSFDFPVGGDPQGRADGPTGKGQSVLVAPSAALRVDSRLSAFPSEPARYRAAGKLLNYFGVYIDRLGPMAGVLAYQRDRVIDVPTGREIPPAWVPLERIIGGS